MKIYDRSGIAEHYIFQLWEKKYFSTRTLTSTTGSTIKILSEGERNHDAGPDFKNAVIKIDNEIFRGDVEIHRAPEDWYQHGHHADPAYLNVVLHLIIGKQQSYEPAIRLDLRRVPAEIFVEISDHEFPELEKSYNLTPNDESEPIFCRLSNLGLEEKLATIDSLGERRLLDKAERLREMREFASWNQIFYSGLMEAMGYSKNQIPFRKLASRLPFEALQREKHGIDKSLQQLYLQAILFGVAGLLPSQDQSYDWRKIKDKTAGEYLHELEGMWKKISLRLAVEPLKKEEWLFFRLRPANFPTRRIAGVSLILQQFFESGFLERILNLFQGLRNNKNKLKAELVKLFICEVEGYWAKYFTFSDSDDLVSTSHKATLIGKSRAREIVINVVLPGMLGFALETADGSLKADVVSIYKDFPKSPVSSVERKVINRLFDEKERKNLKINAARQQGIIHLYKLYCRHNDCGLCMKNYHQLNQQQ